MRHYQSKISRLFFKVIDTGYVVMVIAVWVLILFFIGADI